MNEPLHIGIDLGGTNIRAGILQGQQLTNIVSEKLEAGGNERQILEQIFRLTDPLFSENVASIGIGVPGLPDEREQLVYDVVNIPSWKKVPLQKWMREHYGVPVFVNNDANCFALGEYKFGRGRGYDNMIGLTLGTGLGSGIILNGRLYSGRNGGAGEFGMLPYLDQVYEYYASGQFFSHIYKMDGTEVFELAKAGNEAALEMYAVFGRHFGNAVIAVLFALDPELVVIGGSLKNAFPYFEKSMWEQLDTFPYQQATKNLQIVVSDLLNSGLAGAAALFQTGTFQQP